MTDIEKKALLDSTEETLISMKSKEITILGDVVYIGSCITLATITISSVIKAVNPEANLLASFFIGGISLFATIISYLKKKIIIKNAYESALKTVECNPNEANKINAQNTDASKPQEYDKLTLEEKCNILIAYAREVSYPGFEDDAHILCDIIEGIGCYEEDDMQTYGEALKIIEQSMLDKAYKFYNGDFSR